MDGGWSWLGGSPAEKAVGLRRTKRRRSQQWCAAWGGCWGCGAIARRDGWWQWIAPVSPLLHAPACQQAWEWAWTHQDASPACDNPNSAPGTSPMEVLFPRHQSGLVAAVWSLCQLMWEWLQRGQFPVGSPSAPSPTGALGDVHILVSTTAATHGSPTACSSRSRRSSFPSALIWGQKES